ncbi:MAG: hypothetical protein K9M45_04690 [Kiritimatiellales bacterium]|nr:hypothetical protein [Kiritimatiellales bacterium]
MMHFKTVLFGMAFFGAFMRSAPGEDRVRIDIDGRDTGIVLVSAKEAKGVRISRIKSDSGEIDKQKLSFELAADKDRWREGRITFTPDKTGSVSLELAGVYRKENGEYAMLWSMYDSMACSGAKLGNRDFEISGDLASQGWQMRGLKAGREGGIKLSKDLAFSGNAYAMTWHSGRLVQTLSVTADVPVVITFRYKVPGEKERNWTNQQTAKAQHSGIGKLEIRPGFTVECPGLPYASELPGLSDIIPENELTPSALRAPGMTDVAPDSMRQATMLRTGWYHIPVYKPDCLIGSPQPVTLPHQFHIRNGTMAGWYVNNLAFGKKAGRRYVLTFNSVRAVAAVYANGKRCAVHAGSFTPFEADITEATGPDGALVAVYVLGANALVDEQKQKAYVQLGPCRPTSLSCLQANITDPVVLEERPGTFINDVHVISSVAKKNLTLCTEIMNRSKESQTATLSHTVATWPDGKETGPILSDRKVTAGQNALVTAEITIPWETPPLWSPQQPKLLVVRSTLTVGSAAETVETRFGFREFGRKGKQFILNGKPIKLRGPSRTAHTTIEQTHRRDDIVQYYRTEFLAYKENLDANAVRLHARIHSHAAMLAADEVGMLLDNQSGIWSAMGSFYRNAGQPFLDNTREEFREWVRRDRNSPSVAIWDVENEMIRGGSQAKNMPWVSQLDAMATEHDATRLTCHAGAGWFAPEQDISHLHMQEHYIRIMDMWKQKGTFPLVVGEFWVGGRGEGRLPSSTEFSSSAEYYEEMANIYNNYHLGMRYYNVSGIMPFQISGCVFQNGGNVGADLKSFSPIRSRKVVDLSKHALASVTAFFWPRRESVATDGTWKSTAVVCNDSESTQTFLLKYEVGSLSRTTPSEAEPFRLAPGGRKEFPLSIEVGAMDREITLKLYNGAELVSQDTLALRPLSPAFLAAPKLNRTLYLSANDPLHAQMIANAGIVVKPVKLLPPDPATAIWIIGSDARTGLSTDDPGLKDWLAQGGALLVLPQSSGIDWLPFSLGFWNSIRDIPPAYAGFGWPDNSRDIFFSQYAPIYADGHPLFNGIPGGDLRWWSGYDGRVNDHVFVRPSAVAKTQPGTWRVLAGASRYENISIAEARCGRGTVLLMQNQVLRNFDVPEARALFMNALRYLDGGGWTGGARAALAGSADADELEKTVGVPSELFSNADPAKGHVLFATPGTPVSAVKSWAEQGGRVVVLSAKTAGELPGFGVEYLPANFYMGFRAEDHPLLWGVSSINFTDTRHHAVKGVLNAFPSSAKVLLHGMKSGDWQDPKFGIGVTGGSLGAALLSESQPVAVAVKHGAGEIIVTTIEPFDRASAHHKELLSTLFANAGLDVPFPNPDRLEARALFTAPVTLDGRLTDDWLEDIEDRNVSFWRHAEPIYLPATSAVEGTVENDMDLSAIFYTFWDETYFNVAAILFGKPSSYTATFMMDGRKITVTFKNSAVVAINGKRIGEARSGPAVKAAKYLDANELDFTRINSRMGNLERVSHVPNRTFEARIPWSALGGKPESSGLEKPFSVELSAAGRALRIPKKGEGKLVFDPRKK